MSAKRRVGLSPFFKNTKKIKIGWNNKDAVFHIKHQIDFDILRETFIDNQYDVHEISNPNVIMDLGSNIGATAIKFHLTFPNALIYAFEPDPNNFERLKQNTAFMSDSIILDDRPVSDTSGNIVKFYTSEDSHWSSSLIERKDKTNNYIERTTVSLDAFFKENKLQSVDIVKCDIEGAEEKVFRNSINLLNVNFIVGELHPNLIDSTPEDFFKIFTDFDILELDKKSWLFKLKNKKVKLSTD